LMAIKKELFTLFSGIEIDKRSKNMNLWWEWDENDNVHLIIPENDWSALIFLLYSCSNAFIIMLMMVLIKIRESGCGKIFFSKNFSPLRMESEY
jgi:hypothetical protein